MIVLVVPGFFLVLAGLAALPVYGDAAGLVFIAGFLLMLVGAAS
jgi:uncharacterized protein YybS (DUF2232 family)